MSDSDAIHKLRGELAALEGTVVAGLSVSDVNRDVLRGILTRELNKRQGSDTSSPFHIGYVETLERILDLLRAE